MEIETSVLMVLRIYICFTYHIQYVCECVYSVWAHFEFHHISSNTKVFISIFLIPLRCIWICASHSLQYPFSSKNPQSLEKLSSVNKSLLLILKKKLAVRWDVTPSSLLQHLLKWRSNAIRSSSGSGIYHHLSSCLSVRLWVSLLNGVWRKTGGLGGDEECCRTIGAVQSPD